MTRAFQITTNLDAVRERIASACARYGRDPSTVRLLAVSKTKPLADVEFAIAAGQVDFGENYLQDAMTKVPFASGATWHFIGHVQSNKTRDVARYFDWVHTVDSAKVARRLSDQRDPAGPPISALIQVNVSGEDAKAGVSEQAATELAAFCATCENLRPLGLMTIPRQAETAAEAAAQFARLARCLERVRGETGIDTFTELSMGMSGDLEPAIAEGATWVRIGTDIFGARG